MKGIRLNRDEARSMGLWVMERFTVCRECERHTHTTRERICARCFEPVATAIRTLSSGVIR